MRRGLGKGLSQLLGEAVNEAPAAPSGTLLIENITTNPRQPRQVFSDESLAELADSIREHGVIQPLLVRPIGEGKYELVAGERRLRASKLAGLSEVPVVIRTTSAQESLELALIENVQREDITAMECAEAYRRLIDEFGLNQEQVAQKVGKSRPAIANTLRLLRLPDEIRYAIKQGELSEGHARALLTADSPIRQLALFHRIQAEGLSVREVEKLARTESAPRVPGPPRPAVLDSNDANDQALEAGLSEFFGTVARVERSGTGGRMTLDFYSDEDLTRILDVLGFRL